MKKCFSFRELTQVCKDSKNLGSCCGVTGVLLLHITGKWNVLFKASGIGPTLMTVVWVFYVLVLMFEGRLFKAIFSGEAQQDTAKVFYRLSVFHWLILGISLLAIGVGMWAGHGGRF